MMDINNSAKDLIDYLAAEFKRAAREHSFAAADLAAIGLALKGGLISPYQAIMHVAETDAFRFLGPLPEQIIDTLERGEKPEWWSPEWAESARQYHENRKRSVPKPLPSKVPA
jgi:hypothetical protein